MQLEPTDFEPPELQKDKLTWMHVNLGEHNHGEHNLGEYKYMYKMWAWIVFCNKKNNKIVYGMDANPIPRE